MGKRYWSMIIKKSLLVLVIVFLAGILFDRIINDPEARSPIVAGLIAIGVYFAVTALLGILHAISGAVYLWLFASSDLVDGILSELRAAKVPPPRDFDPRNFDYLGLLADDPSEVADERVKAAAFFAGYTVVMKKGLFSSLAIRKALDDAVLHYSQEAPRRAPRASSNGEQVWETD
jgi:hypothetical protein